MELDAFLKEIEKENPLSLCAGLLLEDLGNKNKTDKDIRSFLNKLDDDESKAFLTSLVVSYQREQLSLEQLVKAFAKKNISVSL